jgi:hypothetical protein
MGISLSRGCTICIGQLIPTTSFPSKILISKMQPSSNLIRVVKHKSQEFSTTLSSTSLFLRRNSECNLRDLIKNSAVLSKDFPGSLIERVWRDLFLDPKLDQMQVGDAWSGLDR